MKTLLGTIGALCSLAVLALGGSASGAPSDLIQDLAQPEGSSGSRQALLIGVSNYTNGWRDLPGATNDIEAVEELLEARDIIVTRLLDPTGETLRSALTERLRNPLPGARELLVYFAGHGATPSEECGDARGFIVPTDAPLPEDDCEGFAEIALSDAEIRNLVMHESVGFARVLFIFDSCFSGMIAEMFEDRSRSGTETVTAAAPEAAGPVVEFITAGAADQEVPDVSVFRRHFMLALTHDVANPDDDEVVEGGELYTYLRTAVPRESPEQTPLYARLVPAGRDDERGFTFLAPPRAGAPPPPTASLAAREEERSWRPLYPTRERCTACPDLMVIPGSGDTEQNATGEDAEPEYDEAPRLPRYAIGVSEVTFAQWDACFEAGICGHWPLDRGLGRGPRPVVDVSVADARQFTDWLSSQTGSVYRLPTEAEWQHAAESHVATARPWGEALAPQWAACRACGTGGEGPVPVRSYPTNGYGLHDVIGNVWEWACNPSSQESVDDICRLRGGGFDTAAWALDLEMSSEFDPTERSPTVGFRVVRELGTAYSAEPD